MLGQQWNWRTGHRLSEPKWNDNRSARRSDTRRKVSSQVTEQGPTGLPPPDLTFDIVLRAITRPSTSTFMKNHTRSVLGATVFAVLVAGCADNSEMITAPVPRSNTVTVTTDAQGVPDRLSEQNAPSYLGMTDQELFSKGERSNNVFFVGLKTPGRTRGYYKGLLLIDKQSQSSLTKQIGTIPEVEVIGLDSLLPIARLKIASSDAVRTLRGLPFVDYVEPVAIEIRGFSASGCDWPAASAPFQYNSTFGTYVPQSFVKSKIDLAWLGNRGQGVKIGLTDTGIIPSHYSMMLNFATGSSAGRAIVQTNNIPSGGPNPNYCSHGSRMGSAMAGPLNGSGVPGVAWQADLHSAIGGNDVVGVGYQFDAIRAADAASSRIITMAWGSDNFSIPIFDELGRIWSTRDVLLVGAAGTSTAWLPNNYLVFPANLPFVLAVSAANLDGNRNAASHYGSGLDIVAYTPVGVPYFAYGYSESEIGNSSAATAVISGVAALVRNRYPTYSNQQVFTKLTATAGATCGISSAFGPIVNALAAIGSFCTDPEVGSSSVYFDSVGAPSQTITVSAFPNTTGNPVTYQWSNGATTPSFPVVIPPGPAGLEFIYAYYSVMVTDTYTGIQKTAYGSIRVRTGPYEPGDCGGFYCSKNDFTTFGPNVSR